MIGDKVDIELHYFELNCIFYGGGSFLPVLSTQGGGGGQNWVKIGPRSC